jgi:predicted DNA-binding transcriptional regulator AlpA
MARKPQRARAQARKEIAPTIARAGDADPALNAIRVLSEDEAAEALGVSSETLRRMAQRGEAPPRLELSTRRIGYRIRDIAAWLDARAQSAQTPRTR